MMEETKWKVILKRELVFILSCFIIGIIIEFIGYGLPNQSKIRLEYWGPYQLGDYFLSAGGIIFFWGYVILLPIRLIFWKIKALKK